jgi:hypothetical protein
MNHERSERNEGKNENARGNRSEWKGRRRERKAKGKEGEGKGRRRERKAKGKEGEGKGRKKGTGMGKVKSEK